MLTSIADCTLLSDSLEEQTATKGIRYLRLEYVVEYQGSAKWESETMGPIHFKNDQGKDLYREFGGWDYASRDFLLCKDAVQQVNVSDPRRAFVRTVTLYGKPKLEGTLEITINEAFDENEATFVFRGVPVP